MDNQQCWCYATIVNTSRIELIDVQSKKAPNGDSKFDLVEFPRVDFKIEFRNYFE